jgi:hypothetical protein
MKRSTLACSPPGELAAGSIGTDAHHLAVHRHNLHSSICDLVVKNLRYMCHHLMSPIMC